MLDILKYRTVLAEVMLVAGDKTRAGAARRGALLVALLFLVPAGAPATTLVTGGVLLDYDEAGIDVIDGDDYLAIYTLEPFFRQLDLGHEITVISPSMKAITFTLTDPAEWLLFSGTNGNFYFFLDGGAPSGWEDDADENGGLSGEPVDGTWEIHHTAAVNVDGLADLFLDFVIEAHIGDKCMSHEQHLTRDLEMYAYVWHWHHPYYGTTCVSPSFAGPVEYLQSIADDGFQVYFAGIFPHERWHPLVLLDDNLDRVGDRWMTFFSLVDPDGDPDSDGLTNRDEYRWLYLPVDADSDDDGWSDGEEVAYWNDPSNDEVGLEGTTAPLDPDAFLLDTDGDLFPNSRDHDSDGDGFNDGAEISTYHTYPEFADSDCLVHAQDCTDPATTTRVDNTRVGKPGTGDGLPDALEKANWDSVAAGAWQLDYDGDDILNNLLDADADGDEIDDGTEFLCAPAPCTLPNEWDTDRDGLLDGRGISTGPGDGRAAKFEQSGVVSQGGGAFQGEGEHETDPVEFDTDGDGMPDGWEVFYGLRPLADDGGGDIDDDGLTNTEEYSYGRPSTWSAADGVWWGGTNPLDADTEGDGLLDGDEVLTHGTNPLAWDTEGDGLPDAWELRYALNPLVDDASDDPDGDFFDQGNDGIVEQPWTNLHEYQYERPASWAEEDQGPWTFGTDPTNPDTDGDGSPDGQEAYFGTDARLPADMAGDDDEDGLNWTEEANLGTNPSDPDTDGDGLCDGGRAPACTWSGGDGTGFQPGEADYGSTPWMTDSDDDGLSDSAEALRWDPGATGAAGDADGDLINGVIDADNDGDGLLDGDEVSLGSDPAVADTDADGLVDGEEVHIYGTDPRDSDTDGDGLGDGSEVNEFYTKPLIRDTDGDGLSDGNEVTWFATDPHAWDTDGDGMPDGWEVDNGLQPTVDDAGSDSDMDGLTNAYEYSIHTYAWNPDTDGDSMSDDWEDRHGLEPTFYSPNGDPDLDGATNLQEYQSGADPTDPDTDGDGLWDGDELGLGSDPADRDSDLDGLTDGAEVHTHGSSPILLDTDGEGLNDYDEVQSGTDPNLRDTDGDGLDDRQEVVDFGGKYDPNDPDTNDDGFTDAENAALEGCPTCDNDNDGLSNDQEVNTYETNPFQADSDCDGAEDGPEVNYWNTRYGLLTFKAYLQDADVDGDGIKDGVEIGTAGTPRKVLYRTLPDDVDSDNDGLRDDEEATNNVKVACGSTQTASSSSTGGLDLGQVFAPEPGTEDNPLVGNAGTALPEPTAVLSMVDAVANDDVLLGLVPGQLYEDPSGLLYGVDAEGLFAQGGYAVRYYLNATGLDAPALDLSDLFAPQAMAGPGTNGEWTDPELPDTDGDGLDDGPETNGGQNPTACDSDGDGLGDGLELGVPGTTSNQRDPCTHRDSDPSTTTNALDPHSDGDGISDGDEDTNRNGRVDVTLDLHSYCGVTGETDPMDVDTDDDGISDIMEIQGTLSVRPTNAFCFDSDGDGLSDGLEVGIQSSGKTVDTSTTRTVSVYGRSIPTFQPSATGLRLDPNNPDLDGDGLLDGLEDVNHDGRFGLVDTNAEIGRKETHPNQADTDGDKIVDGRELLIYGVSKGIAPFADVMKEWSGSMTELEYDAGNPWETDPVSPHSDADSVADGRDLNPRADAFFAIKFTGFQMLDPPDTGSDKWYADLYIRQLVVDLPITNAQFIIEMSEDASVDGVYSRNPTNFPSELIGRIDDPSYRTAVPAALNTAWKVNSIEADNLVRFNLPDDVTGINLNDLSLKTSLHLKDRDFWGNPNDDIDLNPLDSLFSAQHESRLDEDARGTIGPDYLVLQTHTHSHRGEHEKRERDEDGLLSLSAGDTVPKHFIQGLRQIDLTGNSGLPAGQCYGTANCI